jgi:hypothetical protein
MSFRNKAIAVAATVCMGAAGTLLMAGSASATDVPKPDPHQSAALQAWLDTKTATAGGASSPSDMSPSDMSPSISGGKRLTYKHGGPLLWTATTLEWYWTGSKMNSSTADQSFGYVFPNTASKGGTRRTLATSSQHNWSSTMHVGAAVPTPIGGVDVYHTTIIDHFELLPGGKYEIN